MISKIVAFIVSKHDFLALAVVFIVVVTALLVISTTVLGTNTMKDESRLETVRIIDNIIKVNNLGNGS
jgi:hypothetical protein